MVGNVNISIKVLFIDNDLEDAQFFEEALNEFTSEATFIWRKETTSLKKYLQSNRNEFNIIFLDVEMAPKDGIQCLKEIRSIPDLNIVPVIMFSTFSFKEYIESTLNFGANLYVVKPIHMKGYIEEFKTIFSKNWQKRLTTSDKENYLVSV